MVVRPICEPVELPIGAALIAERVAIAPDAPEIGRFIHFHDVAELVLFGRVRGEFTAAGRRHRLRDGSIVFVPSMRQHDYALERGGMDWLLVQIDPYLVERLAARLNLAVLGRPFCAQPDPLSRSRIAMLGEWLVDAANGKGSEAAAERILELLLMAAAEAPTTPGGELAQRPEFAQVLLPALERLRTAPEVPLSLATAATLCRLSPTYFSRRFRKVFGTTFSEYGRTYRLHLAARRLVTGRAGIAEIAFGVGFSSPAHFTARFRERFGMTPREYRRSARQRGAAGKGS